jgi:hypothetical protein
VILSHWNDRISSYLVYTTLRRTFYTDANLAGDGQSFCCLASYNRRCLGALFLDTATQQLAARCGLLDGRCVLRGCTGGLHGSR